MYNGLFNKVRVKVFKGLLVILSIIFLSPLPSLAEEPRQLPVEKLLTCHTAEVVYIKYSPSGNELASVDRDGCIVLWDVIRQKEIGRFHMPEGDCNASKLQWNSSGDTLLCWADLTGAIIIDRGSLRQRVLFSKTIDLKPNSHYYSTTQSLAISPDGNYVLRGANGTVHPLEAVNSTLIKSNNQEVDVVTSFLELINLNTKEVQYFHAPSPILKVSFTENGRFLAVDFKSAIIVGDINKGIKSTRITGKKRKYIESICTFGAIDVSPDGKSLILGGDVSKIEIWSDLPLTKYRTLEMIRTEVEDIQLLPLLNTICAVAISDDGTRVAAGALGGGIQIWNVKNGKAIKHFKLGATHGSSSESAYEIRFVPKRNEILCIRSAKRNFYVFNVNSNTHSELTNVGAFDLSTDGKYLAVSDGDGGAIKIHNILNMKE